MVALTSPPRPLAVAFDVNETLTDLGPVADALTALGFGPDAPRWWFAVLLRDGMALAASSGHAGFADLAAVALDELAAASERELPADAVDRLIEAMARVPVRPDVAPALDRLAAAGVAAFALTNGGAAYARGVLHAGGVADRLVDVLSVDAVGHWKPRPEPYRWAAEVAGVAAERLALVAVHPWDVHGAASAGLVTGWVDRTGRSYPSVFAPPSVQARDLVGVVDGLLALGGG